MKLDVTECEVLSLDSGSINCPLTAAQVPVLFLTIRIAGQLPANLAIRNPHRLAEDLPVVMKQSSVLNGGEFVPEHKDEDQ